jgi:uncharacterized protein YndB with AHSA1/START domain
MRFTTHIDAPIARTFDRIARLDQYADWLPPSNTFAAMRDVSESPARLGTTYVDQGQSSPMPGQITEYQPPQRIAFRQEQKIGLGTLRVEVAYTLEATAQGTAVTRDFAFHTGDLLVLMRPLLSNLLRKENERILAALKADLESQP